jgi:hypothetical protein
MSDINVFQADTLTVNGMLGEQFCGQMWVEHDAFCVRVTAFSMQICSMKG